MADSIVLSEEKLTKILSDERRIEQLQTFLRQANFTYPKIAELLDEENWRMFVSNAVMAGVLYGLDVSPSTLGVLSALFVFGGRVPVGLYNEYLPEEVRELFSKMEIVKTIENESDVEGQVTIREFAGSLFLSDRLYAIDSEGTPQVLETTNIVWPMSDWTINLFENLSKNPEYKTFLDVGCGSGCIAILSHARYERVYGIDLNPRAILFSKVNAKMNNINSINFELSSCFDLPESRQFDHLAFAAPSGPNFSDRGCMFTFGGRLGHELGIRFLKEVACKHLSKIGCADLWCIFSVEDRFRTVRELIETELDNFPLEFTVEPQPVGSLYISNECIVAQKLPPFSQYGGEDEGMELLAALANDKIFEVIPTRISVKKIFSN